MRRTSKSDGRRCEHVKADRTQCRSWAVVGSDPPLCNLHMLNRAELRERGKSAAAASVARRRVAALRRPKRKRVRAATPQGQGVPEPVSVETVSEEQSPEPVRPEPKSHLSYLRREWNEALVWSDTLGAYVPPYPDWLVGEEEDSATVQSERPAPIPPDDPRVRQLPDGRVMLEREGDFPLLLEREEDTSPALRRYGGIRSVATGLM
jgi:hypothetical protein